MSSAPAAASAKDAPNPKLLLAVKICNILNAAMLVACGVVYFVLLTSPAPLQIITALYVIAFGIILFCFEMHLKAMDRVINRNFGFMFSWGGRTLFFLLVGTLCFGLGAMGIATGCVTGANLIFSGYVLCTQPHVSEQWAKEFDSYRERATAGTSAGMPMASLSTAAASASVGAPASVSIDISSSTAAAGVSSLASAARASGVDPLAAATAAGANPFLDSSAPAPSSASSARGGGDWKKFQDDATGKYYYHNSKTQETKWENDNAT